MNFASLGLAFLTISIFFITWMANNLKEIDKNNTGQSKGGRIFVIVLFSLLSIIGIIAMNSESYDKDWKFFVPMFLTLLLASLSGFFLSKIKFYEDSKDSQEREDVKKYNTPFVLCLIFSLFLFVITCFNIRNVVFVI